jgi:hypothetical protein
VSLNTKAIEVLRNISEKMIKIKKIDEIFNPEDKVLKVRSMK